MGISSNQKDYSFSTYAKFSLHGKCNNDYNDNNRFVGYGSYIRTVLPGEEPFSHIPTYPCSKLAQEVVWNIL